MVIELIGLTFHSVGRIICPIHNKILEKFVISQFPPYIDSTVMGTMWGKDEGGMMKDELYREWLHGGRNSCLCVYKEC